MSGSINPGRIPNFFVFKTVSIQIFCNPDVRYIESKPDSTLHFCRKNNFLCNCFVPKIFVSRKLSGFKSHIRNGQCCCIEYLQFKCTISICNCASSNIVYKKPMRQLNEIFSSETIPQTDIVLFRLKW
jgi:hypothetical protein